MNIVNKIYNEDCIKGMKKIPDNKVDLIITDPPFAINFKGQRANYNRDGTLVLDGYNEIPVQEYFNFSLTWLHEATRILKDTGSMFVFSSYNNIEDIQKAMKILGLHIVNHVVWQYQFGVVTKRKFVTSHYICIFACKDDKKRNFYPNCRFKNGKERYADMEDVWKIKREYWHGKIKTPNKLPSELVKKLIEYTSKKGDLVFDPFLGSGQVCTVAKSMKRMYCGFEIVSKYWNFAVMRLSSI